MSNTTYSTEVRREGRTYSVFGIVETDGKRTEQLYEGGFFSRTAAEECARELLKAAHERKEK